MKDGYTPLQFPMNSKSNTNLNAHQIQMVKSNLNLVGILAQKTISKQTGLHGLTTSDLTSAGEEALISAACHYDSNQNASFKTYASRCIWNAMVAEIESLYPSHKIMNEDEEVTKERLFIHSENSGLDLPIHLCCSWETEHAWQLEMLNEAIATLSPEDQSLVRWYFGFDGEAMKLNEIAYILNISPQAVHKRLKKAEAKLRTFMEGASSPYRMCA